MAKKWADPLDRLLEADEKASVLDYLNPINKKKAEMASQQESETAFNSSKYEILEINTNDIIRWIHKDRPENELGNISELADTFKSVGQQQPCILRPSKSGEKKYELIVGERRWRAAELAKLPLKAIVKDIDDKKAALIQAIENEQRNDISEFAKGMSFANKIEKGLISQKDITEILGINKQQVTRLLSYSRIPKPLFAAIEDFRKVSSRTAYELVRLANKDEKHLSILIKMADKISDGSYGQKKIEQEIKKSLSNFKNTLTENKKVIGQSGKHLFTWRIDGNAIPSIHFPREILNLINEKAMNFDEITEILKTYIDQKVKNYKCAVS